MKHNFLLLNRIKSVFILLILLLCGLQFTYSQGTFEVKGTIIDASDRMPIPMVNIVEKGTKTGSVSDMDGNFSIKVSNKDAKLEFSMIGYKTTLLDVAGKSSLNVELNIDATTLDDIVVIGFGSVRKADLTGAVSTISGAELNKIPVASVAEALTGRLAGVQVSSSEGSPDADIVLKVRGGGSLTQDSTPLILVDGFPVSTIADISPNDIENITVLKDASSTAIYGARGANGVVLITTKSGTDGEKLTVNYTMFSGFRNIAKTLDVLDPFDYASWQYEYAMLRNNGNPATYEQYFGPHSQINQYANEKKINWQREIYGRTGRVNNHSLSLRGGGSKIGYNLNFTRYDEEAIMIGSGFERNNLSFNVKNKHKDKIELSFTLRYSDTKITGGGANEQREFSQSADARFRHVVGYPSFFVPGLSEDDPDEEVAGFLINPFIATADNDRLQTRRNFNMITGMKWKIINNLELKTDIGLDYYKRENKRFYGRSTFYVRNVPLSENQGKPAIITEDRNEIRFRLSNYLSYDFKKLLNNDHRVKLMVGQEIIDFQSQELTNVVHGLPLTFNFDNAQNLTNQGKPFLVNNFTQPQDRLVSFFARVNYDLYDKFLLTATTRADGSSKFLGDNRWGYFSSGAVAYKLSEEEFLKKYEWLNQLKIRLSYGQAGNNNIPDGQQVRTFISNSTAWINGFNNFFAPSSIMPNPELKWETMVTRNIGLDYELFNGRLNGTFDAYRNSSRDLLFNFQLSGGGYSSQYRNMGEVQNSGFEGSFNYAIIRKKDYGLNFSFNINFNNNKIVSLGLGSDYEVATNWASTAIGADYGIRVGQPIGLMLGYQSAGRYEVSDFDFNNGVYTLKPGVPSASAVTGYVQPGAMKLKDVNGDGVINQDDITVIGNAQPIHTGGFNLSGNVKNFDFSANFNWSFGQDVYNATKIEHSTATSGNPNGQYRNLLSNMSLGNRWTNINPANGQLVTDPTELAALNANTTTWSPYMQRFVLTDWAIEDASFLRLNTLTIGYSFPDKLVEKLKLTKLRFYATANNVFVLTNYSGLDPEVSTRRRTPETPNVDFSPYPRSRLFVFGLNLNF